MLEVKSRYVLYKVKRILNVHKHIDGGWFWSKYSAHPYVGCEYGCEYCYWRDEKYNMLAREDAARGLLDPFSQYIKVKENAPELLEKELSRVLKDIIVTGDYQPAEAKFHLSRRMLEVCLQLGFPVLINEKSPLVLRDLDVIGEINRKTWACVLWSIANHESQGYLERFEPRSPTIESRFAAMKKISEAGIPTGTAFMPILPYICDNDENLEAVVKKTAQSGGSFVLAGSLAMSGAQASRYMQVLQKFYPHFTARYNKLYRGGYSPDPEYSREIARKVARFCEKHKIADRMPRYIMLGEFETNKRVSEKLFLDTYRMEVDCESPRRIWAYRKAAWAIDELKEDVSAIYRKNGLQGLEKIPNIGKSLSRVIEDYLQKIENHRSSI